MIESVSRRAFSGSSGTYHVQALELAAARERKLKGLSVAVVFLDDTEHTFNVEKRSKGSHLLELVYQHLELVEKDYFGLQYSANGCPPAINKPEYMRWLDPSKSIKKQLGNCQLRLYFRVKFYVSDPSKLQEEYTRYQFYLQIRRDILEGRLHLPPSKAILLASYTVQSELGDYQPDEHGPNYLSNMQLMLGQTEDMERKISEIHKLHKGQLPADAEFNFLDHAKRLEMYGVELHKAKDNAGKDIQLGVTSLGLVVFQNNIKINIFSWSKIMKISFKRKQFFIQLRRELSENYDTLLGFNMETYRSSKMLWKACVEHHTFFRLHSPKLPRRFTLSLGSKFTYSGRTEFQTVEDMKQRGRLERKFVRSPSKILVKQVPPPVLEDKGKILPAPGRPPRLYDNKITSAAAKEPRKAWEDDARVSDDDKSADAPPFSPHRVVSYVDEEPHSPTSNGCGGGGNGSLYDTPPYSTSHSPTSQVAEQDDQVTVVLYPDESKIYGFKVDADAFVSHVVPNSSAGTSRPGLCVGDQLLQINDRDVTSAIYGQIIQCIEDARKTETGKLELVVKPRASCNGDEYDEIVRLTPLEQSIVRLENGLSNGSLVGEYSSQYRKHPDLTCDEAELPQNTAKNRYRDISPYDKTRVILTSFSSGDYINANHVNMKITGTETLNRYIATQGPLPNTVEDFWQMVFEQQTNLIVMLTTLFERDRPKCHQYWPSLDETLDLPSMSVKCVREQNDETGSFVFRNFILTDSKDKTEREIKHMQYIAWPDHDVPDSPTQFLDFTNNVRQARGTSTLPVIVHCSAGIGRTGVLILMDTALCLMEADQPINPLDILRMMRLQRAMMIQNSSQYRFVCESVLLAYKQKVS